ncbi:DNA translocase FtsK [Alphaproteobacteria bacterium endosymbiont of Tiliacea citrago]|uniref:DNA translocase FtsK n=1 Tax=Alphaproteobacteria bacterium endosymbiont of Tiliacea citrago TaxID=3077944 RepID=UPI00313CBF4E
MFQFSKKKNWFFFNVFFLALLTFINFILTYEKFGVFEFFFSQKVLNSTIIDKINYYYGFSFLPCIIISLYSFFQEEMHFYLYFSFMFSFDFFLSLFSYGGGFSTLIYLKFGFLLTLICFIVLFVFSWLLCLYLILEFRKKERLQTKKVSEIKEKFDKKKQIHLPGVNLLSVGKKLDIKIDVEDQKALLIKTLQEFKIEAKIVDVFIGPVVSLYSIELAPGIKAIRVISLSSDIARSMESFSVRIAAIPGKNLLGVEISNPKRQLVYFKEGMQSEKYINFEGNLPLYLGCNIYGEHEVFDLSKMPHLLIAGTTGSGKSVGIHTVLLSLMFQKTYEEVKFILIDPKKLELTPYEEIPYLLLPVVTEAKDAIKAVKWAVNEMESRYKAMSKIGVRNIISYNQKVKEFKSEEKEEAFEEFNYIVIIIDEMADLMLLAGKEFELYVQRLAQMGRAAGVHMIIATQRPSVDVITGTIKANFPTRISFKLSTKVDSRTILGDMSGAEQLLGAGDMLYLGNDGKLTRIHGSYVSEEDVLLVVDFLKAQASPKYIDLTFAEEDYIDSPNISIEGGEDDPLYEEAVSLIKAEKKVSTSFLQRCFPIGYNRAAKLIEKMEKEGVITKGDRFGRNREIL